MNKIGSLFVLLFSLIAVLTFGQDVRYCGQTEQTQALFEKFPHLRHEAEAAEEQLVGEEQARNQRGDDEEIYIIPVVFHIIHDDGPENISDEQVHSAMEVLNRDFRMLNDDLNQVIPEFADITADVQIEFRLAKRDPNGNCSKGINRVQSSLTYEGGSDMKSLIQWPRNDYMNVWTCADAGGAAGYTFLPSSVDNIFMASQDGIVLLHSYTGAIGTSSVARSRTLTHEVGHWLNLRHTWGSGNNPGVNANCDQDDAVADTPNTVGWSSCDVDGESCGDLDNVQNYMEYSYCSRMFTQGQRSRMRTAAQSTTAQRNQLSQQSNLVATGVLEDDLLCAADFYVSQRVICVGEEVQFFDDSFHDISEWSWSFGDEITVSGNDPEVHRHPIVTFDTPGVYTVTLSVGNGEENLEEVKTDFLTVLPAGALPNPFVEGFEDGLDEDLWFIQNQHDNVTWELTGQGAYSGDRSVRIRNVNNSFESSSDDLISTTVDLSEAEAATISYRWAFTTKVNETDDRLRISISNDCGESWALRKLHRGYTDLPTAPAQNNPFTPSSQDEWSYFQVTIDNPDYLVESFRFKFEFEGRGGNNIYLDDINLNYYGDVNVDENESSLNWNLYPNPMGEQSRLEFTLNESAEVSIGLYDMVGREVRSLVSTSSLPTGQNVINIDRRGLSSGVYMIQMEIGARRFVKRLVVK